MRRRQARPVSRAQRSGSSGVREDLRTGRWRVSTGFNPKPPAALAPARASARPRGRRSQAPAPSGRESPGGISCGKGCFSCAENLSFSAATPLRRPAGPSGRRAAASPSARAAAPAVAVTQTASPVDPVDPAPPASPSSVAASPLGLGAEARVGLGGTRLWRRTFCMAATRPLEPRASFPAGASHRARSTAVLARSRAFACPGFQYPPSPPPAPEPSRVSLSI